MVTVQTFPAVPPSYGTSYELGAGMLTPLTSGAELVASVGYQAMSLKQDDNESVTSGIVARLGLRLPLGG